MHPPVGEGSAVVGERIAAWNHEIATQSPGRVCTLPGCDTVLSVYNSTGRCALHRTFVTIIPRSSSAISKV
jgi:hypothetical protein